MVNTPCRLAHDWNDSEAICALRNSKPGVLGAGPCPYHSQHCRNNFGESEELIMRAIAPYLKFTKAGLSLRCSHSWTRRAEERTISCRHRRHPRHYRWEYRLHPCETRPHTLAPTCPNTASLDIYHKDSKVEATRNEYFYFDGSLTFINVYILHSTDFGLATTDAFSDELRTGSAYELRYTYNAY